MLNKKTRYDLKRNYPVTFQLGLIGILLISIGAVKLHFPQNMNTGSDDFTPETPSLVLSPVTKMEETPAPPVLPAIPNIIPDDSPIETPPIDFGNFDEINNTDPLPPAEKQEEEPEIFDRPEFMPELRGGVNAIYSQITYPELAKRNGIEGTVIVQFIVNEEGKVENPKIIRGIGGGCNEEVLRVIKLQKFTPGIQNGKLIKVRMSQAIRFRLK